MNALALAQDTDAQTQTGTRGANVSHTCLVLNASFQPLTMVPIKRALRLVMENRAEIEEVDGTRIVRSASGSQPCPTVIRLVRMVKVPQNLRRKVTNTILFARDGLSCSFCGRHKKELRGRVYLTRDHVIPKSRFKTLDEANTWDNVVTACSACNNRKADRTPEEAGMALRTTPTVPHFVHLEWSVRKMTPLQAKYISMFFGVEVVGAVS